MTHTIRLGPETLLAANVVRERLGTRLEVVSLVGGQPSLSAALRLCALSGIADVALSDVLLKRHAQRKWKPVALRIPGRLQAHMDLCAEKMDTTPGHVLQSAIVLGADRLSREVKSDLD